MPTALRVLRSLAAPALVLAGALLAWATLGAVAALVVLAAGWGGILVDHAINLDRLKRWAGAPVATPVPEARGAWGPAFAALHQRTRVRRALERDLTHTIERFQSAAEAIPDGMVVLDGTNRIKWANARAQRMLGLDLAHDVGAPLTNLVRQPAFVAYLEAGDHGNAAVLESQRDPGTTLEVQIVPFGVAEKLLISRDITEIEGVARMRRDFIANVSHELKTPLTVISGFIETLQDLVLEDRQRERFLELMREQAASMQRLVEDLLTLSALESEHNTVADETFAVGPLLDKLAAEAGNLSHGAHAVALEAGEPALVTGSRDELASAFGNLVSNAVRYTPAQGRITLSWRIEPDGSGVFSVADSGIGIGAEHLPRLTERFYRVDRSRSRATGGTGLGLAIVKHVLLRHQADLAVVSEPGKGSTFSVRLPPQRVRRLPVPPPPETAPLAAVPAESAAPVAGA